MSFINLFKKLSRKAEEAVHPIKLFPSHAPLANEADGDEMTYSINDACLEIGQGGTSALRGWATPVFLCMIIWPIWMLVDTIVIHVQLYDYAGYWLEGSISWSNIFLTLFQLSLCALGFFVGLPQLYLSFFSVTDPTVRLDRKHQKAYLWTGTQGVIEIDWNSLTPRIESHVSSLYATSMFHHGQYVELGPDGKVKKTGLIPHQFRCGVMQGTEMTALWHMEFVRRYMEEGLQSLPPVKKLLRHRPKWWQMFNLFNVIQDWIDWHKHRGENNPTYSAPWGFTIFAIVLYPFFFSFQFCNWLALRIAPIPKWPKKIREMHESDLDRIN